MATINPFMKHVTPGSLAYFHKSIDINGYVIVYQEDKNYALYIKVLNKVEAVGIFTSKKKAQDAVDKIKETLMSLVKLVYK